MTAPPGLPAPNDIVDSFICAYTLAKHAGTDSAIARQLTNSMTVEGLVLTMNATSCITKGLAQTLADATGVTVDEVLDQHRVVTLKTLNGDNANE